MNITDYPTAKVSELKPGSILASGHVVESVATGGFRFGPQVQVTFTDGLVSRAGRDNLVHVKSL